MSPVDRIRRRATCVSLSLFIRVFEVQRQLLIIVPNLNVVLSPPLKSEDPVFPIKKHREEKSPKPLLENET